MSNENMNEEQNTQQNNGGTKTFTQDDVNRIVQDRLAKDRVKASEELDKREQELKDREFRLNSRQKLIERGLPEDFIDVLNCSSEGAFDKALDRIEALIKERTPDEATAEHRANKAVFTMPPFATTRKESSDDSLIRQAMKM